MRELTIRIQDEGSAMQAMQQRFVSTMKTGDYMGEFLTYLLLAHRRLLHIADNAYFSMSLARFVYRFNYFPQPLYQINRQRQQP